MRRRDREELKRYIRWVANEIGLRDWTFEVRFDAADLDVLATVHPTEGRRVAVIELCPDFRDRPAGEQRQTIVHELVHCHHAAASDIIRLDLVKRLGEGEYDLVFSGFRRQLEYMVDALAEALAPHLPLIDWPGSKPATAKRKARSAPSHPKRRKTPR